MTGCSCRSFGSLIQAAGAIELLLIDFLAVTTGKTMNGAC